MGDELGLIVEGFIVGEAVFDGFTDGRLDGTDELGLIVEGFNVGTREGVLLDFWTGLSVVGTVVGAIVGLRGKRVGVAEGLLGDAVG